MKRTMFLVVLSVGLFLSNCHAGSPAKPATASGKVIEMTNDTFKKLVFNYEANKAFKFEGKVPVIIDFYATWCGPCRMVSPLLEEMAVKYDGKLIVYKVDTDKENLLASKLGIQSLPTLLFIPVKGDPRSTVGALPKEMIEKAIHEVLLIK
ncbi:MAG: thioredoxin [Marinilabiliales bacterium]|nr:thioredoxin [Marinilabiliales bacterium]